MSNLELDIEKDAQIDPSDLTSEFKIMPILMYRYSEVKVEAEDEFELLKAEYGEKRSELFVELKSSGEKLTEKQIESIIDVNPLVKRIRRKMLSAKRDLDSIKGFVEALKTKKEMLHQLGADARLEAK